MKKTSILALLLAGLLTASACAVAAQARETAEAETEITAEEETDRRERKKHGSRYGARSADGEETTSSERQKTAAGTDGAAKRRAHGKTVTAGDRGDGKAKAEAAEPEGTIGKDAAKEAALADARVEADGHVRARYAEEEGVGIYRVKFKVDGMLYRYKIHAETGEILERKTEEAPVAEKSRRGIGKGTAGKEEASTEAAA